MPHDSSPPVQANVAPRYRFCEVIGVWCAVLISPHLLTAVEPTNPAAIQELAEGKRTTADAAWWGFDAEDSTEAIQAAFDSGAAEVVIPAMPSPWIVRPLNLRSDQVVTLESGTVLLAKEGEFLGGGDSLLTARDVENLVIRGNGGALRMRKRDYLKPPYQKAEWRMGLSLRGCRDVVVEGLRIESSGGDGIYVDGGGTRRYCENVVIRDVICDDNHRQGMSVISAKNLVVEDSQFVNTWGTAPGAGIDLEPDGNDQSLEGILIRRCIFENNEGHEILVYPKNLGEAAPDLSIRFEDCVARKTLRGGKPAGVAESVGRDNETHGWAGICVAAVNDHGPGGTIEFVRCVVENSGKESVRVFDKSLEGARLRFVDCQFKHPWLTAHPDHWRARVPIHLHLRRPDVAGDLGGIEFVRCHVHDRVHRPTVYLEPENNNRPVRAISGTIVVHAPGTPWMALGPHAESVELELSEAKGETERVREPDADAE